MNSLLHWSMWGIIVLNTVVIGSIILCVFNTYQLVRDRYIFMKMWKPFIKKIEEENKRLRNNKK